MRGKTAMEKAVNFRANDDEITTYNRAWRQLGFKSRSQFHRNASNVMATGGGQKHHAVSPVTLLKINTHLNRIGSVLSELMIAFAANDNLPLGEQFGRDLRKALQDINTIRQRVS